MRFLTPNAEFGLILTVLLLFVCAFLAATVLPLASEAWLVVAALLYPEWRWLLVAVATLGNSLGSATTYWLGRRLHDHFVAHRPRPSQLGPTALRLVARWGPPSLLLSWVPVLGDALVAVAGWLRLRFYSCMGWIALGKGARYVLLVWGAALL
ncbi:DedA family protein [Parvibium lacunae]|uniref:DedA family protein n=2 Tax=Parvibium lacunae TaxID=1888893 RepID=A0A368L591_9BURK|nr:DedA family protein [Parvibium lacunae]